MPVYLIFSPAKEGRTCFGLQLLQSRLGQVGAARTDVGDGQAKGIPNFVGELSLFEHFLLVKMKMKGSGVESQESGAKRIGA